MTREELEALIAGRLLKKYYKDTSWSDITGVVGAMSSADRMQLVTYFSKGDGRMAGELIQEHLYAKFALDAADEAETMLADNTLTYAELVRIFG